jgi:hypothetical protein
MGMDKDRLGLAIWTFVKTQTSFGAALTAPLDAAGLALWKGIANEIILEIQGHAVVTSTTTTPNAQAGPTTLPGTATGTVA